MSVYKVKLFHIECNSCQTVVRVEWRHHGKPPLPEGWGTIHQAGYSWDYCPLCMAEHARGSVGVRFS
jgi:hypothetical protein